MKKVMKVQLKQFTVATLETGQVYMTREWEIPFESTTSNPATALEDEMKSAVSSAFPAEFSQTINHMMYSDMAMGGTLAHGDLTLTVSLHKAS